MNRNFEWESFVRELKSFSPPEIEHSATKAVLRAKSNMRLTLFIKLPAACVFAVFVLFVTLANTSSGFIRLMGNIPLLGRLSRAAAFAPRPAGQGNTR